MAIRNGGFFAFEAAEKPLDGALPLCLSATIGHYLGEGFGLVEKV
ncbi:MAG: hypothetical protein R3D29_09830 [Nitratireductor sp.]